MERLIATLFLSREVAHREHLRVTGVSSYAAHMALASFYDAIVDLADSLAEAYQGRHGALREIPILPRAKKDNIADELEQYLGAVEELRTRAVGKDDSALQNIVDEIVALYLSTLYKLRRLK